MIRFLILMIALIFGAYAQYDAWVTIETNKKINAISKNIGTIMSQTITQHKNNCLNPSTCANSIYHEVEARSQEQMDSLLSKTIYAELSKY